MVFSGEGRLKVKGLSVPRSTVPSVVMKWKMSGTTSTSGVSCPEKLNRKYLGQLGDQEPKGYSKKAEDSASMTTKILWSNDGEFNSLSRTPSTVSTPGTAHHLANTIYMMKHGGGSFML